MDRGRAHEATRVSFVSPQNQKEDFCSIRATYFTVSHVTSRHLRVCLSFRAVSCYPKHMAGYWAKVARMVGTRSAAECHQQHTSQGTSQTPNKKTKKSKLEKVEAPKEPGKGPFVMDVNK